MTKWTVVRVWREVEADTALGAINETRDGICLVPHDEVRCAERIRLLTDDDDPVAMTGEDEWLLSRRPASD